MSYFMGIDLGTSSTKTLIMEENGKTAGIGNASYGIQIPQISYAEQDPLEWWHWMRTNSLHAKRLSILIREAA